MQGEPTLEVKLAPGLLAIFFPLFQEGVELEVETGCTIKQLLTEQFGISADYLAERITTLFLNSRAVDDAAKAVVENGAVLALSGAMPGLVGATMRSGGYYAAMRGAMTYRQNDKVEGARRGVIKVKLFNLLLEELGPRLLMYGIHLTGARLRTLLNDQYQELRPRAYRIDGRSHPVERFRDDIPADSQRIRLKAEFGE